MHDGQPQPGPFTDPLGGEEGKEDLLARLFVHAAAVVAHPQAEVLPRGQGGAQERERCLHFQGVQDDFQHAPRLAHGMEGIRAQIHHHLVDLARIRERLDAQAADSLPDGDRRGDAGAQQLERFFDDRVHRYGLLHLLGLPAEGQDLLNQLTGPLPGGSDLPQIVRHLGIQARPVQGHLGVTHHGGEDVVEVVGDAPGHDPDGLHALGMPQLDFQLRFPRDVPGAGHHVSDEACGVPHRRHGGGGLVAGSIGAHVGKVAAPGLALPHRGPDLPIEGLRLLAAAEGAQGVVDQRGVGESCERLGSGVRVEDPAQGVRDDDGVRGLLDGRGETLQLLLGALPLGDVAQDAKGAHPLPSLVLERCSGYQEMSLHSILLDQLDLVLVADPGEPALGPFAGTRAWLPRAGGSCPSSRRVPPRCSRASRPCADWRR